VAGGHGARQRCMAATRAHSGAGSTEKCSFSNYFQILFHSNEILNYFKAVSKVGVKMKVIPFFKIYNFTFMTKVQFQIDFELQNKININSKP